MVAIDTGIVVRYLTGDHPRQSVRARQVVDEQPVLVPVMLETEWVLRSAYGHAPVYVAPALRAFCGLPQVTIEDAATVAATLDLAGRGMDLADALHLARGGTGWIPDL